MPSDTRPEIPSPWRAFLEEVDSSLREPVTLHCLGGFVAAMLYGVARATSDLDYIEVVPPASREVLASIAGEGSPIARRHGLYFQYFGMASLPESYDERLIPLFHGRFEHLHLLALEAHDLALSKLARNNPVDRQDVAWLARAVPLSAHVLQARYHGELRHALLGDRRVHDATLAMWLEAYFPKS